MTLSFPCTLGDYTLLSLIKEKDGRLYFDAIQISTSRKVILEMPDPETSTEESIQEFLHEVRVKASVDSPLFTTVYEASKTDGKWYFSYEKPDGASLANAISIGKTFSTHQLLELLKTVSKAEEFFDSHNLATSPISPDSFFEDSSGGFRMINPVIPGTRKPDTSALDMISLGNILPSLITPNVPGATRIGTIASWMRDGQEGKTLTWQHVAEMVDTVEDQLGIGQNATTGLLEQSPVSPLSRYKILLVAIVAILAAGAVFLLIGNNDPDHHSTATKPKLTHPVFDGRDHMGIPINPGNGAPILICDAYEVTIGAYKNFLDSIKNMPEQGRKSYDHPNQPPGKTGHTPLDWEAMLDAAQHGKVWEDYAMSMRTPVFNVDFWDAYAYAKWKGYRLPTLEEWKTIADRVSTHGQDPMGPVDNYLRDVGEHNLCGFNSGVSEWTSSEGKDPSMPMEAERPIVCGGHSGLPGKQRVIYVPSPDIRSKTIGFRTVHEQ